MCTEIRLLVISILACGVLAHSGLARAEASDGQRSEAWRIEKLEPPNWWIGFRDKRLQLLIYGPEIAKLTPVVNWPGIRVEGVSRVTSRNYLFVNLHLGAEAEPGSFDISFTLDGQTVARHPFSLAVKEPSPAHARGFSNADAIYLITPDRFANGDPENDNLPDKQDPVDRSAWQGRHGGDLQGILDHLDYIEDMGFTAIWLNPVLENRMPKASYHGYATTDFYQVDPRFGDNAKYRELAQVARERGIGLIMDMIVNHSGSEHWWLQDPPTQDWFNGWPDARTQTTHEHVANMDLYASEHDRRGFADGWFVEVMPDLNQRNPLLARYLIQNTLWWIEYLGLAGIRMDTYPYPDKDFMTEWTSRVMEEYPNFNIVGEEWHLNPVFVAYWQAGRVGADGYVSHLPSLMDFPLQSALVKALNSDSPGALRGLYQTLAQDVVYPHPERLVVFPDNHDMSRIFTQLNEDYALFRMTIAYCLTIRGAPQLYYGTEILMHNRESNDHGLIRSDFPGGWEGDAANGFTGRGLSKQQRRAQALLRKLLHWRRGNEVIHRGELVHFIPRDNVYVYFRHLGERRVMVAFNKNQKVVRLDAARFAEQLRGSRRGREVIEGRLFDLDGTLELPARDVVIVEIED